MPRFVTRVLLVACALIVIGMVGCSGSTPVVVTQIVTVQVEGQPPQMIITETADPANLPDRDPIICQQGSFDTMLTALLAGTCDFARFWEDLTIDDIALLQELAARDEIAYETLGGRAGEQITMNMAPPPDAPDGGLAFFADVRVRQAIAFGTNRERMAEAIYRDDGRVMHSFLPDDDRRYLPEASVRYAYDPEQARARLSAAGWQDLDGDGFVEAFNDLEGDLGCRQGRWTIPAGTLFEVDYLVSGDSDRQVRTAELFAEDMAAIGIKVTIRTVASDDPSASDMLARRQFQLTGEGNGAFGLHTVSPVFGGPNVYRTPDNELQAATTLLDEKPALLFGIPMLESEFIMGTPDAARLPIGYILESPSAIPNNRNDYWGSNTAGWCDATASVLAYEIDLLSVGTDPVDLHMAELQRRFLDEVPFLPLYQYLIFDVHAPNLCGTVDHTPITPPEFRTDEWYFGFDCP